MKRGEEICHSLHSVALLVFTQLYIGQLHLLMHENVINSHLAHPASPMHLQAYLFILPFASLMPQWIKKMCFMYAMYITQEHRISFKSQSQETDPIRLTPKSMLVATI